MELDNRCSSTDGAVKKVRPWKWHTGICLQNVPGLQQNLNCKSAQLIQKVEGIKILIIIIITDASDSSLKIAYSWWPSSAAPFGYNVDGTMMHFSTWSITTC